MKNYFCNETDEIIKKKGGETEKTTIFAQNEFPVPMSRLEMMVLMGAAIPLGAIRRQIASGIDIIVHLGRLRDKSRKVMEVSEILDYCDGEVVIAPIYVFEEVGEEDGKIQGVWKLVGTLTHTEKLLAAGYQQKGRTWYRT